VEPDDAPGALRIGELSRRVGVSDHLLRAWESRYGLLRPMRSPGGFRLYTESDETRVRSMQSHLARGLSAAEAARATIAEEHTTSAAGVVRGSEGANGVDIVNEQSDVLRRALDDFDEPAAQHVLDRLLSEFTLATVLRDVVLRYLHELGERWERGDVTVAQEHFASNVLRGRLAGLARGWGNGRGPLVVVACPPGELHDLPVMIFGIILNRSGWRVDYFGTNTPIEELVDVVQQVQPDLVVLAATTTLRFTGILPELSRLADMAPLALAGAGATQRMTENLGARLLIGDPVTAAQNEGRRG
jgi:MerR family transcriptional regulator, light-induced transcriptional regulator